MITGAVGRGTSFILFHSAARKKVDHSVLFSCNQQVKRYVVVSTLSRLAVCSLPRTDAQSGHIFWRGGRQVAGVYVQNRVSYFRAPASEGTGGWRRCDATYSAEWFGTTNVFILRKMQTLAIYETSLIIYQSIRVRRLQAPAAQL
jgi:hypothetical protein